MNQPEMFRKKKNPFGRIIPPFFSWKVQNLTVFSIIYMIRIRFFGPVELNQRTFSDAQYSSRQESTSRFRANDVHSAAVTGAVKSAGEARPPEIAKYGATKESDLAVSRRRRLEELREQWERQFGHRVKFF